MFFWCHSRFAPTQLALRGSKKERCPLFSLFQTHSEHFFFSLSPSSLLLCVQQSRRGLVVRANDVDDELAAVSAAVEVRGRLAHRHAHVASHAETLSPERAHVNVFLRR